MFSLIYTAVSNRKSWDWKSPYSSHSVWFFWGYVCECSWESLILNLMCKFIFSREKLFLFFYSLKKCWWTDCIILATGMTANFYYFYHSMLFTVFIIIFFYRKLFFFSLKKQKLFFFLSFEWEIEEEEGKKLILQI